MARKRSTPARPATPAPPAPAATRTPAGAPPDWVAAPLAGGGTLGAAAAARPVLLVFLRHSG